ncbi:unnamed protein product, partial [Hapterophycus canaliculatus]
LLRCTTVASPAQTVQVGLSVDGVGGANRHTWPYTFHSKPWVVDIKPSGGSVGGGTIITVTGDGFEDVPTLGCRFGSSDKQLLLGEFVSTRELICVTPVGEDVGPVPVEVTVNGIDFSRNGHRFTYHGSPFVTSVNSTYGDKISVHGRYFFYSEALRCLFDQSIGTPGRWVSHSLIECALPSPSVITASKGNTVALAVSFNSEEQTEAVLFEQERLSNFSALSPNIGSAMGGTAVLVRGSGFVFRGDLLIRFGDIEVPATFLSETLLLCVSPGGESGFTEVVPILGMVSTANTSIQFQYVHDIKVNSVTAVSGGNDGAETIVIRGENFVSTSQLECWFGGRLRVQPVFGSASEVSCDVPLEFGRATLEIGLDGDVFAPTDFAFVDKVQELRLTLNPASGPKGGGTPVIVSGRSFPQAVGMECRFGQKIVPAIWLSQEAIQCESPAGEEAGQVPFAAVMNMYEAGIGSFTYAETNLFYVLPEKGEDSGGTLVTIFGHRFDSDRQWIVWFGSEKTPAVVANDDSTSLQCLSPPRASSETLVILRVSDGFSPPDPRSGVPFEYVTSMEILSLDPASGSILGGTSVVVKLRHDFGSYKPPLRCGFGEAGFSASTWFNETTVVCVSPPSPYRGKVLVTLHSTINEISSGSTIPYWYFYPPMVSFVYPLDVEASSRTPFVLTITGGNFVGSSLLSCRMNEVMVGATWTSDSVMECAFAGVLPGEYAIEVSNNMADFVHAGLIRVALPRRKNGVSTCGVKSSRDSTERGTIIEPVGQGVKNLSSVRQSTLENMWPNAITRSTQHVECVTAVNEEGVLPVSVGDTFDGCSHRVGDFSTVNAATTRLIPEMGPEHAGSLMKVDILRGRDRHDGDFWSRSVDTARGDSVTCSIPTDERGLFNMSLSCGGVGSSDALPSMRFPEIMVYDVFPVVISSDGGSTIYVRGRGFQNAAVGESTRSGVLCFFDGTSTAAVWVSKALVLCRSPPKAPGMAMLRLSSAAEQEKTLATAALSYVAGGRSNKSYLRSPTAGPTEGGTVVSMAETQRLVSPVLCLFGDQVTWAFSTSLAETTCAAPTIAAPGHLKVDIISSDNQEAMGEFEYKTYLTIEAVHPAVVDVDGGTTVTALIKAQSGGIANEENISCKIGDVLVPAWVHPTRLRAECDSPARPPGSAVFTLWSDGRKISRGDFVLTYAPLPIVSELNPVNGFSSGGLHVDVYGHNFVYFQDLACFFGNETATQIQWLSTSQIRCTAPKLAQGTTHVKVSFDGVRFSTPSSFSTYEVHRDIVVTRLDPIVGHAGGGTVVTVSGNNFPLIGGLQCLFGDEASPAMVLSETSLECVSPRLRVETVVVELQFISGGGRVNRGGTQLWFRASSEEPIVQLVSPLSGPVKGGTNLAITGAFLPRATKTVCRFQGRTSVIDIMADWLSQSAVACVSPRWHQPEQTVDIRVLLDGKMARSTRNASVVFDFNTSPLIDSIHPRLGPASGGTGIRVRGANFRNSSTLACFICKKGSDQCITVSAGWVSPRELICITPRHEPGLTAVKLAFGGSSTTANFLFTPTSSVTNIHPSAGGTEGGTQVLVSGTNLALTGTAMCRFGDISTKAAFNAGGVVCSSPKMTTPHKVFLEVSVNGADFTSDEHVFEFFGSNADGWSIAAQPSYGDRRGGTQVVVHVAKMPASETLTGEGEYECVFDDLVTPARVASASSVRCLSPSFFVERVADLRLRSTGGKGETAPTLFEFLPAIELHSLYPASGQYDGGDTVVVHGAGFLDTSSACCRFGEGTSPAELLSMTTVRCTAPPWASKSSSTVTVEVSHNCEDFYGGGLEFMYNEDIDLHIKNVSENTSPHSSAGDQDHLLQCRVGNTQLPVVSHNEHRSLVCSSLVDTVSGSLTQQINGVGRRTEVSLLSGPVGGGSMVQISGLKAHQDGLFCRFAAGERVVYATASPFLHAGTVECPTPTWPTSGTVLLQVVSDDAGILTVPTPFLYYSQPILHRVEPPRGTTQGHALLRVVTSGTSTMAHPTCGFFSASYILHAVSTATWTTKSDVWCRSPVMKPGRVFVEVASNGVDFTRGSGLVFTMAREPVIWGVKPLVGGSMGGTEVAIRGIAFANSGMAVCHFDGAGVPATVVDDNIIVCTAPPTSHQLVTTPMVVDFSLTLNDNEVSSSTGALLFTYSAYPTVSAISPKTGSIAGGTSISVEGDKFVDTGTGFECMFGAVATQATVFSINRLICDSPPHNEGEVAFAVRYNGGRAFALEGGPSFVFNFSLQTLLPAAVVPATFFDTGVGTYVFPPSSNNSHSMDQGTSDQLECKSALPWRAGSEVSGCYVMDSRVEFIRPDNGPRVGGTPVVVTGMYLVGDDAFMCHFGSKSTSGFVVDTNHLVCSAPPSRVEKPVHFHVTRNGQPLQSNGIAYYFKDPPVVVHVQPRLAFKGIGAIDIMVTGEGFQNSSSLACLLEGETSVRAKFVSDKLAVCSVSQNVGFIPLQLTNNGVDFRPSGHGVTFIPQPVVMGIDRSAASSFDDAHFLVSGLHFMDAPQLTCVFGELSTPAEWLSVERVKCRLPKSRISGPVHVALTLDRQELDERSASVEYLSHPRIPNSVEPAFGPSDGGTVVFIQGYNLHGKGETVCRFSRAGDAVAQVLNDSTVRCVSPSSQAGEIRIQIGTSNGSFSSASVAFSYIVRPTVASLQPLAGKVDGGTRVTVHGSGFSNITELECHFGTQPSPKVTFVSAGEVICDSPSSMTPTVVPVTVLLNGVTSASSLNYRYAPGATVLDVTPHDVDLNKSRWLTVAGVNFNQGAGLGCLFNATHSSVAQWLSSSLLRCPIPVTLNPGSLRIGVTVMNDGKEVSASSVSIIIRPRLTIHSVLPATARWDQQTPVVTVLQAHYAQRDVGDHVFCLFDDEPVLAVSSLAPDQECGIQGQHQLLACVAIRCTAPAQQAPRNSSLRIVDGAGAALTRPVLFPFEATPMMYSISPGFGVFGGGTAVTIEHKPSELFTLPETAGCTFSDAHDAIFVGGEASTGESGSLLVVCVSPPWRINSGLQSEVKLDIVLDGLRRDIGSSFVYSNRTKVFAITPRWATDKGGTEVRIRGIGFSATSRFSCHFTDERIPPDGILTHHLPSISAVRLSDQDLLCESPPRPPGPAFITVAADGKQIDGSTEIVIRSSAHVSLLSPWQGPASGGTVVDLTGNNFFYSGSTVCRIGSYNVPATFVNSHSLLCATPRSPPGSYPISIAFDGEHFEDSGLNFRYLEEMTVMSLTPSLGWTTGGTNVSVRITGLQSYGQDAAFFCQFGSHLEAAIKVNVTNGSLVCSSPTQRQALQGEFNNDLMKTTVSIVDSSGVALVTSTAKFCFVEPVIVTAVVPDRGPPGTHVHVLGEKFDDSFGLECLFGNVTNVRTRATLVTSERLDCRTTVGRTGPASVRLLIGGALTALHTRASFTFEQPIVLLSLEPESGRHGESTAVKIRGRGFQPSTDLVCWFGELEAFATVVSSTEVRCHTPPQGRGRVRVSLSAWQKHSSEMSLFFSYETEAFVPRLVPAEGSVYGGTLVTIQMDIHSTETDLRCTFTSKDGINASSAVKVEGDSMKCKTPPSPGLSAGYAWMSLTEGGTTVAGGARFSFFNPPVVRSIHPQSIYKQDGARLEISGENFFSSKELACKFSTVLKHGAVSAPAQFISPTKIACITPVWDNVLTAGIQIVVDVTVNGVDFTSGGPAFSFQPAAISTVWPSSGSASGGTPVTVFGSSFAREQVSCVFGTSTVSAWVMTPSRAVCISPTATQGFEGRVPFHLAIDGRIATSRAAAFTYVSAQPRTDPIRTNMRGYDRREKGAFFGVPLIPSISSLEPSSCSSSGDVNIVVHGSNFESSPTITCSFGGVYSRATFLSSVAVQCVAPRHMPAEVLLEVSNAGTAFSTSGLTFRFHSDLSVFFMEPSQGSIDRSTLARITGSQFRQSSNLTCRFGETAVPGLYLSSNQVECWTPPMESIGAVVEVQVSNDNVSFSTGFAHFTYSRRMMITSLDPSTGVVDGGTAVLVRGAHFHNSSTTRCKFGTMMVPAQFVTDKAMLCATPPSPPGTVSVELASNGADFSFSGSVFTYLPQATVSSVWPISGSASEGGTVVTVRGGGFENSGQLMCRFGNLVGVRATWLSPDVLLCTTPRHRPGLVKVRVANNGDDFSFMSVEYLYTNEISVNYLRPTEVLETGQVPVLVTGSNFLNTSTAACRFGTITVRASFLSPWLIACTAPSHSAQPRLQRSTGPFPVAVSVNGVDYTDTSQTIEYIRTNQEGHYTQDWAPALSPNGTYCDGVDGSNFSSCRPGSFQPSSGARRCLACPIGFICPDFGLSAPVLCPAGFVCHKLGLTGPWNPCPEGHFCPGGVKTSRNDGISNSSDGYQWIANFESGAAFFNTSSRNEQFEPFKRPRPAAGEGRREHAPNRTILAEQPLPCPIGFYCRQGVASETPVPKNFSTPQRCFNGFFCPRGSFTPEGSGPCPTGYFCPTTLQAIECPQGQFCPGVANTKPRDCTPGTYNPFMAQSNCSLCESGYFCPGWASVAPQICPPGFVCVAQGLSAPVLLCPSGYFCKEGTLTLNPADPVEQRPLPCPRGTFCLGGVAHNLTIDWIALAPEGASAPQTCTEGTFCEEGSVSPSGSGPCFEGHYCPPGISYPIETPIGNFAADEGSVVPMLCFPGTYAPLKGANECRVCPSGYTCPSYGTYEPTVCEVGHYRSLSDSVTCRPCPTGTFSSSLGVTDVSSCLPCPPGRICGVQAMVNLTESNVCPAGYNCGSGTDRWTQFSHKCPAGLFCSAGTEPNDQYQSVCDAGYYCIRGTPNYLATQNKCPVGSYCPDGTASGTSTDVRCPRKTTSLVGASELLECIIEAVDVCDKVDVNFRDPFLDSSYYSRFVYTLLDGSGEEITFDSTPAKDPTGEVQVLEKIMPINESGSDPVWMNDTIEVFRVCPEYGRQNSNATVTIIGRNFRDSDILMCRFIPCTSSADGPRKCENLATSAILSNHKSVEASATYISETRVQCPIPEYVFPSNDSLILLDGVCEHDEFGILAYVQSCEADSISDGSCEDDAGAGYRFVYDILVSCTPDELERGTCDNTPAPQRMWNPCYTAEIRIDVTVSGSIFSGDGLFYSHSTLPSAIAEDNYMDYVVDATFAIYTVVQQNHWLEDASVVDMDARTCETRRVSEEGHRQREQGWFLLRALQSAQLSFDLSHIPSSMV